MAYLRFMQHPVLRKRAEADFARLENNDWNETELHILQDAGDAMEALLADRLLTAGVEGFDERGILHMPLAALIKNASCYMSEATLNFCHGVRLARDLVHSTREARTGDSLTGAEIGAARAVAELVRVEMAKYEPPQSPAQAAHTGIVGNPGVWHTIPQLLAELEQQDRDELLLTVLPHEAAWILKADWDDEPDAELDLSRTMASVCLASASPEVRSEFMARFSQWLREAAWHKPEARNLLRLFFFCERLVDLPEQTRQWLVAFVVGILKDLKAPEWPCWMSGLASYVEPNDVSWVVRALSFNAVLESDQHARASGEELLKSELDGLTGTRLQVAARALDRLISICEQRGNTVAADRLASIRYEVQPVQDDEIPREPAI